MLPFYRYMIIHADLYTVHGGFVNWTSEGLGIVELHQRAVDRTTGSSRTAEQRLDEEGRMRGRTACSSGRPSPTRRSTTTRRSGRVLIGGATKYVVAQPAAVHARGGVPPQLRVHDVPRRPDAAAVVRLDRGQVASARACGR